jgi:hypothetical protein
MKRLPLIIAAITLLTMTITNLYSQVAVDSNIAPNKAALLDLKVKQDAATLGAAADDNNVTSESGGLLLPRVKLINTATMEPFIESGDPEYTTEFKFRHTGLMVYNITNDGTLYSGVYTWDGVQWTTSDVNPTPFSVGTPALAAFTFYEKGDENVDALTFTVTGGAAPCTYRWYQITGNNVHVRVGTPIGTSPAIDGTDADKASFYPTGAVKGTTRNANNADFYRFTETVAFGSMQTSHLASGSICYSASYSPTDQI